VTLRVTSGMTSSVVLGDIQAASARVAALQQKLSSGKELTNAADDPYAVSRALQLRNDLASNQQYQRNVSDASSWHSVTDTTLSHISDYVLRARDLVVQGANDTAGPGGRSAIVAELTQIVDSIKSEANTQIAGRYIFSGSATTTKPYALGATDTYAGNTDMMKREIGPGVQIDLNESGSAVIGDSSSGLLKTLRDAITHLNAGDTASLQTTDLAALSSAQDSVINVRAQVGARQTRLDTATSRLQEVEQTQTELLSKTEDADMAKTYVDFSTQQAVYQAALKAGSLIVQTSLLDFLK
jgi:flagellar hook-associated protein 3 FlgL